MREQLQFAQYAGPAWRLWDGGVRTPSPFSARTDQTSCLPVPRAPGGQASFCLNLGPITSSLEQHLAPSPGPLSTSWGSAAQVSLATGRLDEVCLTFVLNSLAVAQRGGH